MTRIEQYDLLKAVDALRYMLDKCVVKLTCIADVDEAAERKRKHESEPKRGKRKC